MSLEFFMKKPISANYCRTPNESAYKDLLHKTAILADRLEIPSGASLRSAVILYLGLCRLRMYSETGNKLAGIERCSALQDILKPEFINGENSYSVNCSYFTDDQPKSGFSQKRIIDMASVVYITGVRSMKKKGLILFALGAEHDDTVTLPDDPAWVKTYVFK